MAEWNGVERRKEQEHNYCLKEKEWGELSSDIKNICRTLDEMRTNSAEHIREGEKVGGYRDRLRVMEVEIKTDRIDTHNNFTALEKEISTIKKGYYIVGGLSGIIGGLIVKGGVDIFALLTKLIGGK